MGGGQTVLIINVQLLTGHTDLYLGLEMDLKQKNIVKYQINRKFDYVQ